ncbi:hypothetical protein [Novosphingobium lindaniclasticum]
MKVPASPLLLGLAALLPACTSLPKPTVNATGAIPQAGGIELVGGPADDGDWQSAILADLAARGFSRSERADYVVQLTTARLPGGTGLFAPQNKADEKTWLVPPTRSRSTELRVYTLVISQRETGRELYRLVGQEPVKQGRPGVEGQLLQAFLTQLGGSTATATARP